MVSGSVIRADERLVMIAGGYGSGKTEISVNLAIRLADQGRCVQIADLDIVNPYFRCREAQRLMERHGIRVVVPPGAQIWADLPIIVPEIQGMLDPPEGTHSLLDVGGDDVGARVLSSLRPPRKGAFELWMVVNPRRPYTESVGRCLALQEALEEASRFKVTGLIANAHLIDETEPADIVEGWRFVRELSRTNGLPIRAVAVMRRFEKAPEIAGIDAPVLWLDRHMLPPWLVQEGGPHGSYHR